MSNNGAIQQVQQEEPQQPTRRLTWPEIKSRIQELTEKLEARR